MKTKDILQETYGALSSNKVRSGLTMLGIIIGISSVIAMVSIGNGASNSISSSISSLGSNLIQITPGAQRGQGYQVSGGRGTAKTLTLDDATAISTDISDVSGVASEVSGRYQITAKGTNTNTTVDGVTGNYTDIRNLEIDQGSFISDGQNEAASKVAVLGPTVVTDLFGEEATAEDAVGQTIRIKGMEFKVIGVTKAKGGTGFGSQDDMIYIPLKSAQKLLAGNKYLTTISVQAASSDAMTQVQTDVTDLLLSRHKVTTADFTVVNQNDLLSTASSVTETLTYLLGAVAGISLIVGGIGIMNMMLTTVTERTREVGLRKAIGAKNGDISMQFLVEAVMLTFVGGIIGVALGWLIAFGFSYFNVITTSVSLMSVLLAFGVSAGIGIMFGYYPARRAASLNPIEALKYE